MQVNAQQTGFMRERQQHERTRERFSDPTVRVQRVVPSSGPGPLEERGGERARPSLRRWAASRASGQPDCAHRGTQQPQQPDQEQTNNSSNNNRRHNGSTVRTNVENMKMRTAK